MERETYGERITIRLFHEEKVQMRKIVIHARDPYSNEKKFENESHFLRSAIMKAIREELQTLKIRKGRPKKAVSG